MPLVSVADAVIVPPDTVILPAAAVRFKVSAGPVPLLVIVPPLMFNTEVSVKEVELPTVTAALADVALMFAEPSIAEVVFAGTVTVPLIVPALILTRLLTFPLIVPPLMFKLLLLLVTFPPIVPPLMAKIEDTFPVISPPVMDSTIPLAPIFPVIVPPLMSFTVESLIDPVIVPFWMVTPPIPEIAVPEADMTEPPFMVTTP